MRAINKINVIKFIIITLLFFSVSVAAYIAFHFLCYSKYSDFKLRGQVEKELCFEDNSKNNSLMLSHLGYDELSWMANLAKKYIKRESDFLKYKDKCNSVYDGINRSCVVFWRNGIKLGSGCSESLNACNSIFSSIDKAFKSDVKINDDVDVHLHIFGKKKSFNKNCYIHGHHGVILDNEKKFIYGPFAVENNISLEGVVRYVYKNTGKDIAGDIDIPTFFLESRHFSTRFSENNIVEYFRGNTSSQEVNLNDSDFRYIYNLSKMWLMNSISESGQFRYMYDPFRDKYSPRNNMIRQLMSSRGLAELIKEDYGLIEEHKKNLNFIISNWYREDNDIGYIYFRGRSKLGANALAVRALLSSPYYEFYKEIAQRLLNGIYSLQNSDGSMEPWLIEPKEGSSGEEKRRLLTFYTGEAILTMVDYYLHTKDITALNAAIKSQDYYLEIYVDRINEYYYPAYVPWHTQSLNKLYKITSNRKYAEAIFKLNDKLLELQNTKGDQIWDLCGRFYNPKTPEYGLPHSSSDAVYTEGLAYAYEIAYLLGDNERVERYGKAIRLGVHNLSNLQYNDKNSYFVRGGKDKVIGAIRINVTNNRIRIDTTQHALDAFNKIEELLSRGVFHF